MKEKWKQLVEKYHTLDSDQKKYVISLAVSILFLFIAVVLPVPGAKYKRELRREMRKNHLVEVETNEVTAPEETTREVVASIEEAPSSDVETDMDSETESETETEEENPLTYKVTLGNQNEISVMSYEDYHSTGVISEEYAEVEILSVLYEEEEYTQVIVPVTRANQWQTIENELFVAVDSTKAEQVQVYKEPNAESFRIGILFTGAGAFAMERVEDETGDWYHIRSGSVDGYIRATYVISGTDCLKETERNVEIMQNDSMEDCMIVTFLNAVPIDNPQDVELKVEKREPKVSHITDAEGSYNATNHEAYMKRISNEILAATGQYARSSGVPSEQVPTDGPNAYTRSHTWTSLSEETKERQDLVNFALQYVGHPYVWGGNSLEHGVDCSGFTQQTYLHFGILLPRCSYEQVNAFTRVSLNDIRPGDLIFFAKNGSVYHVALYIGDGRIVHARSVAYGIVTGYLTGNEYAAVSVLP